MSDMAKIATRKENIPNPTVLLAALWLFMKLWVEWIRRDNNAEDG